MTSATAYWCEHAWLPGGVEDRVRVEAVGGTITAVTPGADPRPGDERLAGVVLPGFADAHSHAFHRALRGRTHDRGGTFWTWRDRMYAVAARLDPDTYLALARATYAELALAGVTAVGEFHYLHHDPAGRPYADPNAMAEALVAAAGDAGVRLTLLDACYLAGGLGPDGYLPLEGVQRRFGDGDADGWARRHELLKPRDGVRVGAAIHSVRAVPADQLGDVVTAVRSRDAGASLHVHLSEQPAENEACLAVHGRTPAELLAEVDAWRVFTTAVHATHLTASDVALLGASEASVCACPSTEADLADGIGPFRALRDAGSPLCLGSDQHVAADLLGEARLLEGYARLSSGERGRFTPGELVEALTAGGQRALDWADAGRIRYGARADLVAVRLDSPRTAGVAPGQAVLAAAASDVTTVVVDGRVVVRDGQHPLGDVGRLLREAIETVWEGA